jgi:hypothetical protein
MLPPSLIWFDQQAAVATCTNCISGQTPNDVLQGNEDTYLSPASNALTVVIDMGVAYPATAMALAGELLNGVAFNLAGSNNNSTWTTIVSGALSGNITAWQGFVSATWRYYKLSFTSCPAGFFIYHAAVFAPALLPWLADGFDDQQFKVDATRLISPQGHYLGAQRQKAVKQIKIDFGQVLPSEAANIFDFADRCIRNPLGIFFVPNSAASAVYFGYIEGPFSAPMKEGLYTISPLTLTARLP